MKSLPVDWVKHFNLTGNPFNVIPLQTKDQFDTLLVKTEDFINQIDPLVTYFEESPPFLRAIVAPRGSGKSTILNYMAESLKSKNTLVCFVTHQPSIVKGERDPAFGIGNDTISKITADLAEALLKHVNTRREEHELNELLQELELINAEGALDTKSVNTFSYSTNQRKLSSLLKFLREHEMRAFLAIDNYDKLEVDRALEFLKSNLAQPLFEELQSSGLSVVLVLRLELQDEIGKGDLNYLGRPVILNPLNPTEAYSLIKKRLNSKSIEKTDYFDKDAITRITIKEEGIPRNILETARLCMAKAAEKHFDFLTESIVQEILRSNEFTAAEYYQVIKRDPSALSGLMSLAAVAKENDTDTFRSMLQALADIWEDRLIAEKNEMLLREHRLLFLSEKVHDAARKKGLLATEIQALLKCIAHRFPLNTFMDWLAAGEPIFTFVPSSEDQITDSTIGEQFEIIIPAFKRDEVKLALRNAYTSYKAWVMQVSQGDYNIIQLLSDMWSSLWGLGVAAYFSEKIREEKRIDIAFPTYKAIEDFLIEHEETRKFVADFVTIHQYYSLSERAVPIDRSLIESLYPRIVSSLSAMLDVSMQILPYLKELGIPLPTFRVKNSEELDHKLAPYIRGGNRYIYQSLEGVDTADFLMLSWIEKNFIFSYVYGIKTFQTDLNLDLYKCQPSTLMPKYIPEYVNKQIAFHELKGGNLLGFFNSFEFSSSIIRMAQNCSTFVKIFSRKNTVDIGITREEDHLLGSLDYSKTKFGTKVDISATNPFSDIKTIKRPITLFLSYSSKDRAFAKQLASDLKASSVKVWVDFWEIEVGDSIIERVSNAIQENDYIAIILSQHSCKSTWVTKELSLALTKELEEKRISVLPLLAKKCEIPPMLRDKHYLNFVRNYRDALEELIIKLRNAKKI